MIYSNIKIISIPNSSSGVATAILMKMKYWFFKVFFFQIWCSDQTDKIKLSTRILSFRYFMEATRCLCDNFEVKYNKSHEFRK